MNQTTSGDDYDADDVTGNSLTGGGGGDVITVTSSSLLGDGARSAPGTRWAFMALAVIPAWILCGNFLVLMAVLRQRSLRTLSNCVIASLAFTDFLLAFLVVPLGVYQLVAGRWNLGLYICLFWTGSDVILSTTSIMHLCAIALYRYNGIANPLRVRSTQELRHVAALVAPSWAIAVALSVPFAVQGVADSNHVLLLVSSAAGEGSDGGGGGGGAAGESSQLSCGLFNRSFAIYSSLVSFFLPLGVMIVADIRSIRILRDSMPRRSRRRRHRPPPPRGHHLRGETMAGEDVDGTTSSQAPTTSMIQAPSTAAAAADEASSANVHLTESSSPKSSSSSRTLTTIVARNNSSSELNLLHASSSSSYSSSHYLPRQRSEVAKGQSSSQQQQQQRKDKPRSQSSIVYINMLVSGGGTSVKINSRERRAERTLIWVFVAFVVLWLPFFCTNLAYGLCDDTCRIPSELFVVFTWLGYLSSGVNPCIYTYLNRDFRNAFKKLIVCERMGKPRLARQYS